MIIITYVVNHQDTYVYEFDAATHTATERTANIFMIIITYVVNHQIHICV